MILKNHRPQNAIAAKFSIEFALACSVLAGRVGLQDMTDEFVLSPAVRGLIERVAIDINPVEEAGTSGYAPYDNVQITLNDGKVLKSENVKYAMGDPHAPLTAQHLWVKFEDCVGWSQLKIDAKTLFAQLQALEKLESANELFKTATPAKRARIR